MGNYTQRYSTDALDALGRVTDLVQRTKTALESSSQLDFAVTRAEYGADHPLVQMVEDLSQFSGPVEDWTIAKLDAYMAHVKKIEDVAYADYT